MSGRAPVAVAAVIAALAAVAPASGHAASGAELSEASGARFPAKAFVLTLPERRALQPGDLKVRENGEEVDDLRVVPGDAAGAKRFGAMLVIDTSRSMRGAPIDAAMAAARQFAARRPAQQPLGVVFFNREATVALAPTTDAAKIAAVLASPPPLGKGTRIYDAARLALLALVRGGVSAGSLVVLSDGADVGSHLAPAAMASAARDAKTRVFTVGLRSRSYDGSTLRELAALSGGRYAEADERQLSPLFAALGRRFGREYLITYRSLSALSTRVDVSVSAAGVPGTASASYRSPALRVAVESKGASRAGFAGSSGSLAVAAGLAALLVGIAAFFVVRRRRRTISTRIAQFTGASSAGGEQGAELDFVADLATSGPHRAPSRRWAAFAEDVDIAALSMSAERIAAWTVAMTSISILARLAFGHPVFIVLAVVEPIVVRMVVSARANRTRREFEGQLADNLQVVAAAMRSGQSFTGALAVAVQDAAEPARRELQRIVADERLGVSLDEALWRTARRMRSEELEYVGLVATLQRETGGNTAEVLDRVTETIRERADLKRLVRTLTAQGRLGGIVVSALPPVLAAFFLLMRPGYFDPLLHSPLGLMLLGLAAAMLIAGWIAIRKIVDIEV
jgi:tight adherence protein B